VHPVRPAPWGVSVKQQKKVMFDALLFRKHPALYRSRIRRAPRWDYYRVVASLLLRAFLTARFCAHRLRGTSKSPAHIAKMVVTSILIPPLRVLAAGRGAQVSQRLHMKPAARVAPFTAATSNKGR